MLESDAAVYLDLKTKKPYSQSPDSAQTPLNDVSSKLNPDSQDSRVAEDLNPAGSYELMVLHGFSHLCFIPEPTSDANNGTTTPPAEGDREKELNQAVSRGSQLLQGMASNPCLYYSTGWWTYAFCYNSQISQFHALPPGSNGRVWPPQEDPTTPSYILGRFEGQKAGDSPRMSESRNSLSTEVKSKAETNYLVQRLEGGTTCDLTGNERKIEVQFHCNPQLTDRIGWIKETATCAYLMIIYTPRLCNDVAFQPPKESRAHPITCQEVISEDEVSSWEPRHKEERARETLGQSQSQHVVLGNIQVGAMKYVGREGKRIERGRIVLTPDEKAETVIMQKDGQITGLSRNELKKLDISPEDVDAFRQELQKLAGSKDWKIERLDDVNGHVQLRGIVATDDDDDEEEGSAREDVVQLKVKEMKEAEEKLLPPSEDDGEEEPGSQEEYAEEV